MKYSFIILGFLLLINCSTTNLVVKPASPQLETMTFDAVTKKLEFEGKFSMEFMSLSEQWFNNKVKVDGLDGDLLFILKNYSEKINTIEDGKQIDITVEFQVTLNKSSISQKKVIEGKVVSYSNMTGNFSLSEFDQLIENTQKDLVLRLSRDFKSKI